MNQSGTLHSMHAIQSPSVNHAQLACSGANAACSAASGSQSQVNGLRAMHGLQSCHPSQRSADARHRIRVGKRRRHANYAIPRQKKEKQRGQCGGGTGLRTIPASARMIATTRSHACGSAYMNANGKQMLCKRTTGESHADICGQKQRGQCGRSLRRRERICKDRKRRRHLFQDSGEMSPPDANGSRLPFMFAMHATMPAWQAVAKATCEQSFHRPRIPHPRSPAVRNVHGCEPAPSGNHAIQDGKANAACGHMRAKKRKTARTMRTRAESTRRHARRSKPVSAHDREQFSTPAIAFAFRSSRSAAMPQRFFSFPLPHRVHTPPAAFAAVSLAAVRIAGSPTVFLRRRSTVTLAQGCDHIAPIVGMGVQFSRCAGFLIHAGSSSRSLGRYLFITIALRRRQACHSGLAWIA